MSGMTLGAVLRKVRGGVIRIVRYVVILCMAGITGARNVDKASRVAEVAIIEGRASGERKVRSVIKGRAFPGRGRDRMALSAINRKPGRCVVRVLNRLIGVEMAALASRGNIGKLPVGMAIHTREI